MAKPPLMGRVKTRLAEEVGPVAATAFYRHSCARLLRRLDRPRQWTLRLAVNAAPGERYACWPAGVERMAQGRGDLGARLRHVLAALPPGPVLIIGTDTPQIEPEDIRAAFEALGEADAVFGPAEDGGYWLIGLARRRPAPHLFEGVEWSTSSALDDTVYSLPEAFRVRYLQTLTDVDDLDSLRLLAARWGPMRYGPWRAAPA